MLNFICSFYSSHSSPHGLSHTELLEGSQRYALTSLSLVPYMLSALPEMPYPWVSGESLSTFQVSVSMLLPLLTLLEKETLLSMH